MTAEPRTLIRDPWRRLWQFFTGEIFWALAITSVALLLVLAACLPQMPANDLIAYSRWLSDTQARLGPLYNFFNPLGLFATTNTLLFRLALALLGMSAALRLIDTVYRLRQPARTVTTRSGSAAILAYGGLLIVLLGLLLGVFIDERNDGVIVPPEGMTSVAGTPYAVQLNEVNEPAAQVTVLRQAEPVAQGVIAPRQPLMAGVTLYLEHIGPALKITAARGPTLTLDLQSSANNPPQPQVLLLFTPEQTEGFVAAPEANLVLRISPSGPGEYTAQIYQSATGQALGSQPVRAGESLTIGGITFAFEPAAYVIVSVVQQPSHGLILAGALIAVLGLLGLAVWPLTAATSPHSHRLGWLVRGLWLIWTAACLGVWLLAYPIAAALGHYAVLVELATAAWLWISGSVATSGRSRWVLVGLGLAAAVGTIGVWLVQSE